MKHSQKHSCCKLQEHVEYSNCWHRKWKKTCTQLCVEQAFRKEPARHSFLIRLNLTSTAFDVTLPRFLTKMLSSTNDRVFFASRHYSIASVTWCHVAASSWFSVVLKQHCSLRIFSTHESLLMRVTWLRQSHRIFVHAWVHTCDGVSYNLHQRSFSLRLTLLVDVLILSRLFIWWFPVKLCCREVYVYSLCRKVI